MKIAIIKFSGKTLDDFVKNQEWIFLLQKLKQNFDGLVLVHGGGNKITEWSYAFGIEPKFVNGQRVTDKTTMEIVAAVQSGLLNTKIVSHLLSNGFNAIGLSGVDRGLFIADYLDENLGYIGIPKFLSKPDWLFSLISEDVIPVFSSICRDENGNLMNVNADVFTQTLALTVKADSVFFLSDVEGVKLNGTTQNFIVSADIAAGLENGEIKDGMIPKLQSCKKLLENGINKIWIGNELFNVDFNNINHKTKLKGTWIVESSAAAV